jgi:hypothetical protein
VVQTSASLRAALGLGIVFNMTIKPATAGAIGAMGVALALGAAIAAVRWMGSRRAQSDGIAIA